MPITATKMMKNISLILLIFPAFLFSQVLDEYPKKQTFYKDGLVNFYKEAHEFLASNQVKECSDKEIYVPRILVTAEGIVKQIKDYDSLTIKNNKCAYDLSQLLMKNLKNWTPALVNGNKFGALGEFIVYPKDLMSNYKENYNADNFVMNAQYPDGNKKFDKEFHDNFMSLFSDYHINGKINLEFYVNEIGELVHPRIYPPIDNKAFNTDFMRTFKRLKKIWKPALYQNIPIKQRIAFPIQFSTSFEER